MKARAWLTKTTPRRRSMLSSSWLNDSSTELGRTSSVESKLERHVTASRINMLAYSGHGQDAIAFNSTCIDASTQRRHLAKRHASKYSVAQWSSSDIGFARFTWTIPGGAQTGFGPQPSPASDAVASDNSRHPLLMTRGVSNHVCQEILNFYTSPT